MIRHYYYIIMCALVAVAVTSCREELCYDHYRRSAITLDYEREWERDYGEGLLGGWNAEDCGSSYDELRPGLPESVSMVVYPENDSLPSLYFLGRDGGEADLGAGQSDILFYNNDTEYVVIEESASLPQVSATTTTRSRSTLEPMHAGERTVSPPDVLYGAYINEVPEPSVHATTPMAVTMHPLVYTYVIRYVFDEGVEFVRLARGALAGMAEKVYLHSGATAPESATVLFDCEVTSWGVLAVVKTFGVPSFPGDHYGREGSEVDPSLDFMLNLEVLCSDGSIKTFSQDVTTQVRRQPRGGVLTMRGLYLIDEDHQVDSGFDVSVDDWGEWVDVELPSIEVQ